MSWLQRRNCPVSLYPGYLLSDLNLPTRELSGLITKSRRFVKVMPVLAVVDDQAGQQKKGRKGPKGRKVIILAAVDGELAHCLKRSGTLTPPTIKALLPLRFPLFASGF